MKIPIQNLYFLLCYAWNVLPEGDIRRVDFSNCSSNSDLLGQVLATGCNQLLKQGMQKEYQAHSEETSCIRGRLSFSESIKKNSLQYGKAFCVFDEYTLDNIQNQLLKATISKLLNLGELDSKLRRDLTAIKKRLHSIRDIKPRLCHFDQVKIHRNNRRYRLLLSVCRFVLLQWMPEYDGEKQIFRDFVRDEVLMRTVFEKFVRNFYRVELRQLAKVKSTRFKWKNTQSDPAQTYLLPGMRTDIVVNLPDKVIVIDTKYYSKSLQTGQFGNKTIYSEHVYQMFAYVSNINLQYTKPVEGIVLYAFAGEIVDSEYLIHGNKIKFITLGMDCEWDKVREQLMNLVKVN